MKKHVKLITPFLMFVFCTFCEAQNKPDLPTDNTKSETKDAITPYGPSTSVRTIRQDKKGNIWLGGGDGLWRYDGSTFTHFTENFVGYVYEDKKGNIWTSGNNANGIWVLSRYDENSSSDKKPTVIEITQSLNLFGILEAHDGSIWFGSFDGVYRYDGNTITGFKNQK